MRRTVRAACVRPAPRIARLVARLAVALAVAAGASATPASARPLPPTRARAMTGAAVAGTAAPRACAIGRNGWYWPTGTEDLGSMGGWMAHRSDGSWHLAKDIAAAKGSPVYALTDGVVFSAYSDLDGYGPGGGPGGAIVVLMRRDDGSYFKALYGHLYGLKYATGQKVRAGAILGYVNGSSPNHLHFGIHPGSGLPTDPQHNVFRGHTYDRAQTYGWTDPVAFLTGRGPWVAPRPVTVTPPGIPASVPAGRIVPVTASVSPAHGAGTTLKLERYRQVSGAWVLAGSSFMAPGAGTGTWSARAVLGPGSWRLRACFAGDRNHLPGASAYTTVTAR